MGGGKLMLGAARDEIRLRTRPPGRNLADLREATLDLDSGVIGAAALAKNPSRELLR